MLLARSSSAGRALPARFLQRRGGVARAGPHNAKCAGLAQTVGHVQASDRDSQSKRWATPRDSDQPCATHVRGWSRQRSSEWLAQGARPFSTEADKPEAQKKCGCGRSPTGFCTGLHALSKEEWAASEQNPDRHEVAAVEPEPSKAHGGASSQAQTVRKMPSLPRSWASLSLLYSCIPTGMRKPTCIVWANLTHSSLTPPPRAGSREAGRRQQSSAASGWSRCQRWSGPARGG